ncbi:FAD-dependent oxidoreductase [Actinopolyspora mortivallis]|uniref:FAD-dependent oxidoreductase n=1 Tax=Actinopolyspora mortivallis TaxID=33906 RepID=UPI0003633425|nr:FAD-dependent oxidoreductase [Actinopolyspora mortivallis]
MAYAITQTCCTDASCVAACPVNCIHPTPDEPNFGRTEMLYVDPASCIDCGACADACPVDAIFPVDALTGPMRAYAQVNADYYAEARESEPVASTGEEHSPNFHAWGPPVFDRAIPSDFPALEIAVVGTGPAGMYAVEDLLLHTNCRVTLIDRLSTAGGLVRYGVAPDHPSTRKIGETFARFHTHPRVEMRLGVEVGRDITTEELAAEYDAVIYAVGASAARTLDVPGEQLPGSVPATTTVAWYNGHPDVAETTIDLSAERAVLVGNGNVALDVARILTTDPDELEHTEISRRALRELRSSGIREVVLLGRRGPDNAAYTRPELLALVQREDVELVVDTHDPDVARTVDAAPSNSKAGLLRGLTRETVDWNATPAHGRKRIVLRFHSSPEEFLGETRVRGVRVTGHSGSVDIPTELVVRAIGHRGRPVAGLPFDERTGTVPNTAGRVWDRPGTYVVGWIKRGPSGGIGANRSCAKETVGSLIEDVVAGRIPGRQRRRSKLVELAGRLGGRLSRTLERSG